MNYTEHLPSVSDILSSKRAQVFVLAVAGLFTKLAIVRDVAVNGDSGLYIYDAMRILQGRVIMVEFPSRSPLFEYILAAVIALGDASTPFLSVRAFMVGVSVALGVAIYALGRELYGHRVGLVSAALFYVTPFSLVWGIWIKTEQAATLVAIVGFVTVLRHIDRETIPNYTMAATGICFGVAFLIRRVAIVHAGAFGLFFLWYRFRHVNADSRTTLANATTTALAAIATTAVSYTLLAIAAGGGPALAWQVADAHALALFKSGGQGSLGWIHTPHAPTIYEETRGGVWSLCQKCGDNTAVVFAKTSLVTFPVALLVLVPIRSRLRRFDRLAADWLAPAILIGPLLYTTSQAALGIDRAVTIIAVLGAFIVWFSKPIDWHRYWRPKATLPVATFLALTMGYLYRDRILYTTYFQDLFPFLIVLVAAGGLAWLGTNHRTDLRATLAVIILVSGLAAGTYAHPYMVAGSDNSTRFTVESIDAYGDDIDARTSPGDRVFTAQPLYVVHSDALPLADLSRQYYLFRSWPDSDRTRQLEHRIVTELESGRVPYVIDDSNLREITAVSPPIREAINQYYYEPDAPIYDRTNATLLAHESTDNST